MNRFSSELQTERVFRGSEFEEEIRRSWRLVPNVWRTKITDGKGGTRPADNLVLTFYGNILSELKRTSRDAFYLSYLRANQAKALRDFDEVLPQNFGLIFVSFQNDHVDEAYAFRFITGLKHMMHIGRASLKLEDFHNQVIPAPLLKLIDIDGERGYDLRRLLPECKYL